MRTYKDILQDEPKSLLSYFLYSGGFHLSVIILVLIIGKVWVKSDPVDLKKIKIIQSAVRVDVVGMPKFTLKELKAMQEQINEPLAKGEVTKPKPVIKEGPKSQETSKVEFKKAAKKVDLSSMLKNLSKTDIKVKKKPIKKAKTKKKSGNELGISGTRLNKLILAGNKLSKGVSLTGDVTTADLTEFELYSESLPNHIRPHWKIPSYLKDQNLQCRIRVYISSSGRVLKSEIFESSGVEDYDQLALKALKVASPLPEPPEDFADRMARGAIILGFPL